MTKILFSLLLSPIALTQGPALAQQPVQPLPKVGSCPLGYYSSGSYCVPSRSGNTRGALEITERIREVIRLAVEFELVAMDLSS